MAKKKEQFDPTPYFTMIDEIEYDLIFKLELGVNNNICTEQDSRTLVQLDGKPICYPKIAFNDYNIIKFDPFFNRKLANFLFQRYVYIYLKENPNIQISSFFLTSELIRPNEVFAVCRTNRGDIVSNSFTNETVCWIDLLYKMEGCQYPYKDFYALDQAITFIRTSGVNKNE
jgi:hypothetical protein